MNIDNVLYAIPVIGPALKRAHSYFRKHVTATDIIHVLIGVAIGLVLANTDYLILGISILIFGLAYHAYAFMTG